MIKKSKKVRKGFFRDLLQPIIPGSIKSSILSLCSITLGSGVLSLPLAVNTCGLALGSSVLIISGFICSFYYRILIQASDYTREYTHAGIAEFLFGRYFKRAIEIGIILHSFGVICAYQAIMSGFINSVLFSFGVLEHPNNETFRVYSIIILNLIIIFPLSLFKDFSALRYASAISVFVCFYITGIIVFQTPSYMSKNVNFSENLKFFDLNMNVVDTLSICLFAYESGRAIPIIYKELKKKNYKNMSKVIERANGLLIFLYSIIGIFGYFSYMNNMPDLVVFRPTLDGRDNSYD